MLLAFLFSFSANATTVEHTVKSDETAWFISQVYYGSGARYTEILKQNKLSSADQVKPGIKLKIENPKFSADNERYEKLRKNRDRLLADKTQNTAPTKMIFVPAKQKEQSSKEIVDKANAELKPKHSGDLSGKE